jgi:hypothetical protein
MFVRKRGLELLIGSVTLGVVLWSASSACGYPSTAPSAGCGNGHSPITCIAVSITADGDGPFTLNFHGTYSSVSGGTLQNNSSNALYYGLQPGTYTIDGTTSTPNLTFYIISEQSSVPGGVQLGSVQSTKGPFVATPSLCHVTYQATGSSPPPQPYSFTFTVGTTGPFC